MASRVLIQADYDIFVSLPLEALSFLKDYQVVKRDNYPNTDSFTRVKKAQEILFLDDSQIKEGESE